MSATATLRDRVSTTVAREMALALTGLGLVAFVLSHLAGNLLIFFGPEALNAYAEKLASLGAMLWLLRIGLVSVAVCHVSLAVHLTVVNWGTRKARYAVTATKGRKSVASRLMISSGVIVLCFVAFHLWDFTLGVKTGPGTIVTVFGGEEELGLFGLVWNSLANPMRALFYIVAVCSVGVHLSHALSSVLVTLGFLSDRATAKADVAAWVIGAMVALGFASIPIYVLVRTYLIA